MDDINQKINIFSIVCIIISIKLLNIKINSYKKINENNITKTEALYNSKWLFYNIIFING